jgi:phage-related protein
VVLGVPEIRLPEVTAKPPHRYVDEVLDGVLNAVKGLSESISAAVDRGPLGTRGPHRGVDAIVKGAITGVQSLGEGVATALDKPLKG